MFSQPTQVLSTIALTGMLSLGGLMPIDSVRADSRIPTLFGEQTQSQNDWLSQGSNFDDDRTPSRRDRFPKRLENTIRRDLSRRVGVPPGQLRVIQAQPQDWPDSCLGLAQSGEFCGQMIVQGWRVQLTDGRRTWIYRTDTRGQVLRLETRTTTSGNLPQSVASAVLREISSRFNVSSRLQIIRAEQRTWNNGCLGLENRGVFCTQAQVPGWLVTVEGRQQVWVYRTDASGSLVRLDLAASQIHQTTNTLQPVRLARNELPPALAQGVVFRAIARGGIAGQTYQTVLLEDGRVMRSQLTGRGVVSTTQIRRISRQQVRQFQRLLDQQQFDQFNRLSYPVNRGADYITVTLSSQDCTTQFVDMIQDQLPNPLQQVIQVWNQIAQGA